jgi:hypothetical protein
MVCCNIFADNDRIITVGELPAEAQNFIKKYFETNEVSYAKVEDKLFDRKNYEVVFVDGSKVEFNKQGEWKEINCKFKEIPAGIVPQKIVDYVKVNFLNCKIIEIDRNSRDYEIHLSNDIELKFDLSFNLIDIDD